MQICNQTNEESKRKVVDIRKKGEEEQEYHHKRKEAHKIIRKKKVYMKNVTYSIEEYQNHNNTRKIYQTVNQYKKGHQHKFSIIRNKKGELAMNTKERAEIWNEYFDKLLNGRTRGIN